MNAVVFGVARAVWESEVEQEVISYVRELRTDREMWFVT